MNKKLLSFAELRNRLMPGDFFMIVPPGSNRTTGVIYSCIDTLGVSKIEYHPIAYSYVDTNHFSYLKSTDENGGLGARPF